MCEALGNEENFSIQSAHSLVEGTTEKMDQHMQLANCPGERSTHGGHRLT